MRNGQTAKPTWERSVEIMKDRASSMERAPSERATDAGTGKYRGDKQVLLQYLVRGFEFFTVQYLCEKHGFRTRARTRG